MQLLNSSDKYITHMQNNIKKILIVEDNPGDARLITECLKESEKRFELIYAKDLSTCLGYLTNSSIDAVLLDLSLPDAIKLEAIDKILKVNDKLPIIILTGLKDKEAAIQSLCMGVQDYIIKGQFDTNLLVRAINYAIERKVTENKLIENIEHTRQSEENYRLLFENSLDGIYRTTIEGDYIDANMALVRMLGYDSKEELLKLNVKNDIYISSKNRPDANKRDKLFETHLKKKDGKTLIVEISPRVIYKDGKPEYYEGIVRDITEKKKSEEELERSYSKLKKTLSQTINTLASIIESKDPYTSGHQKNVARIAIEIAKELKLSDEKIEALNIAALIHDIGKITVPASILSKPGKITEIEFLMIKEHSRTGYENIKGIDFGYPVAEIVLQHHERLNGSGYPDELKEKDISLEAKILAVADVIEAMTSHRPYRAALGSEKAIEELKINSGILYDEKVVSAFLSLPLDVEKIKEGEHLCAFYDNVKIQFSHVVPFIIGGLETNKKCLYILDENTLESLTKAFIDAGYNIDKALRSKQLVLYTKKETYIKDGYFEPEKMMNLLKETEKQALEEGYMGVRITGEMSWVLADSNDLEKLIEYENLLNVFYPDSKVTGICQYNEQSFDKNFLIDIVATHPRVIIDGLIYKNNYFLPPEKFTKKARHILKEKNFQFIKNGITKKNNGLFE